MEEHRDYRDAVVSALAGSNYFALHKAFLHHTTRKPDEDPKTLTVGEALLLSFLLDFYNHKLAKYPRCIWFFCKAEQVEEEINIPRRTQYNLFKGLEYHGFIRIKNKGVPCKRYIKINSKRIARTVDRYRGIRKLQADVKAAKRRERQGPGV